jgi:hypothetical protein
MKELTQCLLKDIARTVLAVLAVFPSSYLIDLGVKDTMGIIAAGCVRSATASFSMVSRRTDRWPRSIKLMWVRCNPALSANASWESRLCSRRRRTLSPNCFAKRLATLDDNRGA